MTLRGATPWVAWVTLGLTAAAFTLDLSLPLGVAGGVPYVLPVLVSLWSAGHSLTYVAATLGTALTVLGILLSPPGGVLWMVLMNRFLAVFAIWAVTLLGLQRKLAEEKIQSSLAQKWAVALLGLQRKLAEEEIQATLAQKEVFLKETHHRIKNNLQIVTGLLSLQAGKVDDDRVREPLLQSQARVRSIELIHEMLHKSEDFSDIDFGEYCRGLATNLIRLYSADADLVSLKIDIEDVSLTVEYAIPLGLIVNELVSNSLKYAFPRGLRGEIQVLLQGSAPGAYTLIVSDNGVGLPGGGLDVSRSKTLGLQLVHTLAGQIGGTVDLRRGKGTEFRISFSPEGPAEAA